jgi:antitoxin VapB
MWIRCSSSKIGSALTEKSTTRKSAKLFWRGRSQAVRLPKEFRFDGDYVFIHREGNAVILEPNNGWPEGYFESFEGIPDDFVRPPQGKPETRRKL